MAEYEDEQEIVKLYRYNEKTKEYKNFMITRSSGGTFLKMMQGTKGEETKPIIIKLSDQELSLIAVKALGAVLV